MRSGWYLLIPIGYIMPGSIVIAALVLLFPLGNPKAFEAALAVWAVFGAIIFIAGLLLRVSAGDTRQKQYGNKFMIGGVIVGFSIVGLIIAIAISFLAMMLYVMSGGS